MTPDQTGLIRATYAMVRPVAGQAALLFEARLAEVAPGLALPGAQVFAVLERAIAGDAPAALSRMMAEAAPVREALLWALARSLGPAAFTPPVQEAWTWLLEQKVAEDRADAAAA